MDYIIDTIMKQIKWKVLHSKGFTFVRLSDIALVIYKGKKGLWIRYNEESDLYDLGKCRTRQFTKVQAEEIENVYCDQLVEIIADFFKIKDSSYRNSFSSCEGKDVEVCAVCGKPIKEGCATYVDGTRVNGPVHKQCLVQKIVDDVSM
jgi:hypothetical protein